MSASQTGITSGGYRRHLTPPLSISDTRGRMEIPSEHSVTSWLSLISRSPNYPGRVLRPSWDPRVSICARERRRSSSHLHVRRITIELGHLDHRELAAATLG